MGIKISCVNESGIDVKKNSVATTYVYFGYV